MLTLEQRFIFMKQIQKKQQALLAARTRMDRGNMSKSTFEAMKLRHRMELVTLVNNLMTQPTEQP